MKINKNSMSYINYNMIFCTRCNRKIFKNEKTREIFLEECKVICDSLDVNILEIDVYDYYVHILVEANPKYSASSIIQKIKMHTSKVIRDNTTELSKLPSLWTREYLVTTEKTLSEGLINNFLEKQKK